MDESLILNQQLDTLDAKDAVTRQDILTFLGQLPPEEEIEHQVSLNGLVGRIDGAIDHLEAILRDSDLPSVEEQNQAAIRFAAFRAIATHHRRNKNTSMLEDLHDSYEHLFSDRPMYDLFYSVFLRVRHHPNDIYRAIDIQESVLESIKENPGIYQAHANTITRAIEDDIIRDEDRDKYLEKARHSIDRAISLWYGYGKYHVTKGRVLALQGQYNESRQKIEDGIDLEDPSKDDYAIRIGQFQQHLLRTDFREYEARLQDRLRSAESELTNVEDEIEQVVNRFRNTMLQFLGFFTAIIAAVITTIQIAANFPPSAAGKLIVMIFGGLIASFGGLSIIIPTEDAMKRGLWITALGLLLIFIAQIPFYLP